MGFQRGGAIFQQLPCRNSCFCVYVCVCAVKVGQSLSWALFECVAAKFPTQSPGEVLRCLGEV